MFTYCSQLCRHFFRLSNGKGSYFIEQEYRTHIIIVQKRLPHYPPHLTPHHQRRILSHARRGAVQRLIRRHRMAGRYRKRKVLQQRRNEQKQIRSGHQFAHAAMFAHAKRLIQIRKHDRRSVRIQKAIGSENQRITPERIVDHHAGKAAEHHCVLGMEFTA